MAGQASSAKIALKQLLGLTNQSSHKYKQIAFTPESIKLVFQTQSASNQISFINPGTEKAAASPKAESSSQAATAHLGHERWDQTQAL